MQVQVFDMAELQADSVADVCCGAQESAVESR